MKSKFWKFSVFFLLFLFLGENLLYLHYSFLTKGKVLSAAITEDDYCSAACMKVMDEKITKALAKLQRTTAGKIAVSVSYVPLSGGGMTTINSAWTAIDGSDFAFDLKDYSAGAKVYWEVNLKARDAGSRCYARIYDKDHYRAVDYSEQSTDKIVFEDLTSQALSIWAGKNHYRLEIKSLNGVICYLESPKLIVKY